MQNRYRIVTTYIIIIILTMECSTNKATKLDSSEEELIKQKSISIVLQHIQEREIIY